LQIAREMESAHTNFTEVTGMEFIKIGSKTHVKDMHISIPDNNGYECAYNQDAPVVVLTTSKTTTSRVLAVLSDTSRDRPIRGHGACESWKGGSAFSISNL